MGGTTIDGDADDDLTDLILTCREDIDDPNIDIYLETLQSKLKHIASSDHMPTLEKVEPWNSIRVTLKLTNQAAAQLRQLAEQGDSALLNLGILSLQVRDDHVILLSNSSGDREPTELVLQAGESQRASSGSAGSSEISNADPPTELSGFGRFANRATEATGEAGLSDSQRLAYIAQGSTSSGYPYGWPDMLRVPPQFAQQGNQSRVWPSDSYWSNDRLDRVSEGKALHTSSLAPPNFTEWQQHCSKLEQNLERPDKIINQYSVQNHSYNAVECTFEDTQPKKRKRKPKPKVKPMESLAENGTMNVSDEINFRLEMEANATGSDEISSRNSLLAGLKGERSLTNEQMVNPITGAYEPNFNLANMSTLPFRSETVAMENLLRPPPNPLVAVQNEILANQKEHFMHASAAGYIGRLNNGLPSHVNSLTSQGSMFAPSHLQNIGPVSKGFISTPCSSILNNPLTSGTERNTSDTRIATTRSYSATNVEDICSLSYGNRLLHDGTVKCETISRSSSLTNMPTPVFTSSKTAVEHALNVLFDDDEDEDSMKQDFEIFLSKQNSLVHSLPENPNPLSKPKTATKRSKKKMQSLDSGLDLANLTPASVLAKRAKLEKELESVIASSTAIHVRDGSKEVLLSAENMSTFGGSKVFLSDMIHRGSIKDKSELNCSLSGQQLGERSDVILARSSSDSSAALRRGLESKILRDDMNPHSLPMGGGDIPDDLEDLHSSDLLVFDGLADDEPSTAVDDAMEVLLGSRYPPESDATSLNQPPVQKKAARTRRPKKDSVKHFVATPTASLGRSFSMPTDQKEFHFTDINSQKMPARMLGSSFNVSDMASFRGTPPLYPSYKYTPSESLDIRNQNVSQAVEHTDMEKTSQSTSPHEGLYTWMGSEPDLCGSGADSGVASNTSLSVGSDMSESDRASAAEQACADSQTFIPNQSQSTALEMALHSFVSNDSVLAGKLGSYFSGSSLNNSSNNVSTPSDASTMQVKSGMPSESSNTNTTGKNVELKTSSDLDTIKKSHATVENKLDSAVCQKRKNFSKTGIANSKKKLLNQGNGSISTAAVSSHANDGINGITNNTITSEGNGNSALNLNIKEIGISKEIQISNSSAVSSKSYQMKSAHSGNKSNVALHQASCSVRPTSHAINIPTSLYTTVSRSFTSQPPIVSPTLPQQLSESVHKAMLGVLKDDTSSQSDYQHLPSGRSSSLTTPGCGAVESNSCSSDKLSDNCVRMKENENLTDGTITKIEHNALPDKLLLNSSSPTVNSKLDNNCVNRLQTTNADSKDVQTLILDCEKNTPEGTSVSQRNELFDESACISNNSNGEMSKSILHNKHNITPELSPVSTKTVIRLTKAPASESETKSAAQWCVQPIKDGSFSAKNLLSVHSSDKSDMDNKGRLKLTLNNSRSKLVKTGQYDAIGDSSDTVQKPAKSKQTVKTVQLNSVSRKPNRTLELKRHKESSLINGTLSLKSLDDIETDRIDDSRTNKASLLHLESQKLFAKSSRLHAVINNHLAESRFTKQRVSFTKSESAYNKHSVSDNIEMISSSTVINSISSSTSVSPQQSKKLCNVSKTTNSASTVSSANLSNHKAQRTEEMKKIVIEQGRTSLNADISCISSANNSNSTISSTNSEVDRVLEVKPVPKSAQSDSLATFDKGDDILKGEVQLDANVGSASKSAVDRKVGSCETLADKAKSVSEDKSTVVTENCEVNCNGIEAQGNSKDNIATESLSAVCQ